MSDRKSVEEIVIVWKHTYPNGIVAKSHAEYVFAYRELFSILKRYGYNPEEFTGLQKAQIIEHTIAPKTSKKINEKRRNLWIQSCEDAIDLALKEDMFAEIEKLKMDKNSRG